MTHISTIEMYCNQRKEKIRLRSLNIDTVVWTFGNEWQMVCGSHNALSALDFDRGNTKSNAFNASQCRLVGNDRTGENLFKQAKRH